MTPVLFLIACFTCLILNYENAALVADILQNPNSTSNSTVLPQNSKTTLNTSQTTTLAPKDANPSQEKVPEKSVQNPPKISWFGKPINTSEIADCQWPSDFMRKLAVFPSFSLQI